MTRPPLSLPAVVLSLVLLAPGAGLAAEDAPLRARLLSADTVAEQDVPAPAPPPSARWRAPRGVRILGELGGGGLTALGAGLVGYLGGSAFCYATGVGSGILGCGAGAASVLGGTVGLLVGYPLGVWGGGELLGGDGRLWAAMLGTGVGVAAGLPFSRRGSSILESPYTPWVLGIAGGVVGYELSQRRAPPASVDLARPRVQPLVSVSREGALLGLGGRF